MTSGADGSLFSLRETRANIKRQDFDATPDEVVLALLDAAETAYALLLAMEKDRAIPSLNVRGCRDELWSRLRRFEEVEWA